MLASLPAQPTASFRRLGSSTKSLGLDPLEQSTERQSSTPEDSEQVTAQRQAKPQQSAATTSRPSAATTAVSVLCRHFTLGGLRSDSPSRVEALTDRLEYYFKHPTHGKVHMVMYYRDFGTVSVKKANIIFKITTTLDMFTAHYTPANPQHLLTITFDSAKDLQQVYQAVQTGLDTASTA